MAFSCGHVSLLFYTLSVQIPYLSAYTAHYFALKIRAKSWVCDIRRYPLSRHEFEYCAGIYRAQYTRESSGRLGRLSH